MADRSDVITEGAVNGRWFVWRGMKRPHAGRPRPRTRHVLLDDYVLDALSSYRDTASADLARAVQDSYGTVSRRQVYRRVLILLEARKVIRVAAGVYRRARR